MATIQVKDGLSNLQTINTLPATGPNTQANSLPVVHASDDPVTVAIGNQVTLQTTANGSLSAIQNSLAGTLTTSASSANNIATSQATVGTTSTLIVAARSGRRTVTIENSGTIPLYIGPAGVTTSTGFLFPGVADASITIAFAGALYGITASGTAAITLYEVY